MSLWEHIAVRLKAKGEHAAGSDLAMIRNARDIQSASRALYDAMKRYPGHHARSELTACFQSRILEETNMSSIYDAFEDMYRIYKQNGDQLAMSIAQMLGEKAHGTVYKVEKQKH